MKTLVVCEKPDAAARVASAIDEEAIPRKLEAQGVTYFECGTREGTVVVCSALGHLYGVDSKGRSRRDSYPVWDYTWKRKDQFEKTSARLGKRIRVISSLARNVDRYVNACDYDIEGSLIGHTILQYACNGAHRQASRMKFSTMTEKELKKAFRQVSPGLDFSLAEAGKCRHELDWLYGINLSRVLTGSLVRHGRGYATLSTGRVQGPTLSFVVEREEEIGCFVPTPFWTIQAEIQYEGRSYPVEYYRDRIPTLKEADLVVEDCKSKLLKVLDMESREVEQRPPYPFDLSSLQSEAYRHFGYSPAKTLAIAEKLYLRALISYPRTSSQKLPPDIGYVAILQGLSSQIEYRQLTGKLLARSFLRPNQGIKDDPAHPAIYPTGESAPPSPGQPEARLFDLIVRRFMSTLADPALWQESLATLGRDSHRFFLRGSLLLRVGWTEFYQPYVSIETQEMPPLRVEMQVLLSRIVDLEKFTQPPARFNPASLLRKMEEAGIGTKSTRAEIIEILYRRSYVKEPRMIATPLASAVTGMLDLHCPSIIRGSFTAKLEELMESIIEGKTTRKLVLLEAMQHLRQEIFELINREEEIGAHLGNLVSAERLLDVSLETPCPECGSGLKIVRNRKTGKRFIGCSGKWEKNCRFSLPLPQFGTISILKRMCRTCGFQMVQSRSRGRRSLISCPRCYAARAQTRRVSPVPELPAATLC